MNRMKLVLIFSSRNPITSFVVCLVFPSNFWMLRVTLPVDAHRLNSTCLLFDHESIYLWRVSLLKCSGGVSHPPSSRSSSVCLLRLLLLSRVGGNHADLVCVLKPVLCFSTFLSLLSRSRSYKETKFGQHGGPRHSRDGQQGAQSSQSGLPVPAYVPRLHVCRYRRPHTLVWSQRPY